jgi:hypothetical protein
MRSTFKTRLVKLGVNLILSLVAGTLGGLLREDWNGLILQGMAQELSVVKSGSNPNVTIWIHNYAAAAKKTVAQAEDEINRILVKAGVDIKWIDCPVSAKEMMGNSLCQERMSPLTLGLVILSNFDERHGKKGRSTPLGAAELFAGGHDSHYIYVNYETILDPMHRGRLTTYELLGVTVAHELGHILLRSSSHSSDGLMQARLQKKDLEEALCRRLFFNPRQEELIRIEVNARRNLQTLQTAQGLSSEESPSMPQVSLQADGNSTK